MMLGELKPGSQAHFYVEAPTQSDHWTVCAVCLFKPCSKQSNGTESFFFFFLLFMFFFPANVWNPACAEESLPLYILVLVESSVPWDISQIIGLSWNILRLHQFTLQVSSYPFIDLWSIASFRSRVVNSASSEKHLLATSNLIYESAIRKYDQYRWELCSCSLGLGGLGGCWPPSAAV